MRMVKSLVPKPEMGKYTTILNDPSLDAGGTVTQLSTIPQGDLVFSRRGNIVRARYMVWRLLTKLAANTSASAAIRMIIFQDNQMNATIPTTVQVLDNHNEVGTIGPLITSHLNDSFPGRFKILADRTYGLNQGALAYDGAAVIYSANTYVKRGYKRLTRLAPLVYNGALGGSISNGQIFVLFITDIDEAVQYTFQWRLGFYDN